MKKNKLKKGEKRLLVIAIILIAVAILLFATHFRETYPTPKTTQISYDTIKTNENYIVNIIEIKEGESPLDIKELRVYIVDNNSQILISEPIDVLLDNNSSNLTFYDKDNDKKLSKGDEFVIKGDLAINGNKLGISSLLTGLRLDGIIYR